MQAEEIKPDPDMEVDKEGATQTQGKKRRAFQFSKKAKRPKLEPKNPVLLLNELKPGLEYEYATVEGPTVTYRCSVVVNDVTYEGVAKSKKDARHKAAEDALKQQIQARNTDIFQMLAKRVTLTPPDGEVPDNVDNEQLFKLIETDPQAQPASLQPNIKHPVMLLNEYAEKVLTYECVEDDRSKTKQKYTMRVEVNGERFEGCARNLKAAKSEAARFALAKLYNVFVPDIDVESTGMSIVKDNVSLLRDIHGFPLFYEMVENTGGSGGPPVMAIKVTVNGTTFEGRGRTKRQAKARAAQYALAQAYGVTGEVPINGVPLFRSPITVLQHYNGPQTAYELTEYSEGPNQSVTASVVVSGESYTATGLGEQMAKANAARKALSQVFKINIPLPYKNPPAQVPPKALMARRGGFAGGMRRGGFMGMPGPVDAPVFYGGSGFSNYTSFSDCNAPMPPQPNPVMQPKPQSPQQHVVKPPTTLLMETHRSSLTYDCTKEEGPVGAKMFTMVVHVNGVPYEGTAKSKKEAKYNAARSALEKVYNITAETSCPTTAANGDNPEAAAVAPPVMPVMKPQYKEMPPAMLLNQLSNNEKHEYTCIGEEGPVHNRLYTMQVISQGKEFTGQARNKKDARAAAARNALLTLYNVQQTA